MAAGATSPIDTLPKELFWRVLLQVRNTSGVSSLISCLLVCKPWHDAVLPLLCHTVLVTDSTLETFITKFRSSNNPHVRSLTISIDPALSGQNTVSQQPGTSTEDTEYTKSHGSLETKRLWRQLQDLSEKIQCMNGLSAFSFVVLPAPPTIGFWIPRPTIASFLRTLPETCLNIEIDTKGQDYCEPGSAHLCDAVRELLPRLKHLRLRVSTMCQALFGEGPAPDGAPTDMSKYIPADVSSLQTLVVNCIARTAFRQALVCGTFRESPHIPSFRDGQEARFVLARCMRSFVERAKCSALQRLWLFDAQPRDDEDQSVYAAFNLRDIVENVTYVMPFYDILPFQKDSFLLRVPSGEEVISSLWAIQALAEGETWKETTSGFRLPAALLEARTSDDDYVVKSLPVLSVGAWKAKNPKKSCILWLNERRTGMRLLEAVKRDGLFEVTSVKEDTPEGWLRDGTDLEPADA